MGEGRGCIRLSHFKEAVFELGTTATTNEEDDNPFLQLHRDAALMMAVHSSVRNMVRMKQNYKKNSNSTTRGNRQMVQVCGFTS